MQIDIRNSVEEHDVIVVGGGPAGCAAAIAAARQGADTLILESTSALGGMATMSLVSAWAPFTDKQKLLYHSIPLEILVRYKRRAGIPEEKWDWVSISPEDLKLVYDEMIDECGAKVLFQSTVCDTVVKDGNIDCLIAANKAGLTPYKAKVYIDCTGDADVAAFSGVTFEKGSKDNSVQPCSLCFIITNVHSDRIQRPWSSNPKEGLWQRIRDDGKYPLISKHFIPAEFGDTIIANAGHLFQVDSTDPEQISKAYVLGRQTAQQYLAALKEYMPEAFCDAMIAATAPILGVRESRRIEGEYCFTLEDYLCRRSFPDEIARNCYWLDCHASRKSVKETWDNARHEQYQPGESHGIPWRCLVPKALDNLLVAGRSISMERMALASIRVMPNCLAMGEAAGIGAAIAAKQGIGIHALDPQAVISRIGK